VFIQVGKLRILQRKKKRGSSLLPCTIDGFLITRGGRFSAPKGSEERLLREKEAAARQEEDLQSLS